MNTILAIDPGYDRCGVAIIAMGTAPTLLYSTCIETNKKDTQEKRLFQIYQSVREIIDTYHPTHLTLETLFFSVNKKTAIKVAESRGVIVLLAGVYSLPLIELSPQAVKQSMTGVGNASKEQVERMVALTLSIDISEKIDDEIDAIALGFAAAEEIRVQGLAH